MLEFLLSPFWFRHEPALLTVNEIAALGPVREPERSQMSRLMRHFLDALQPRNRFARWRRQNPSRANPCAAGIPAHWSLSTWTPSLSPHLATAVLAAGQSSPLVLYSFVAMGIAMVFEWDMFFPDLLDVRIKTLPVKDRNVFLARVAAIAVLVGGFLSIPTSCLRQSCTSP